MASTHALLDVSGAEKTFGANRVLGGIDFSVARGEFVSLLGPSGCGKTTLLRIVAGLMAADRGSVRLDGAEITNVPTHKRNVGVVFQNYALFPHLTVAENVAFGLRVQKFAPEQIGKTVERFLDLVHLGEKASQPVRGLSGGQQQRVAVARALAVAPKLLLLDEPFSALDRKLREGMQIDLKRILREVGITTVLVTHDQEEALVMSDRIAVMNRGEIEQFAAPADVYLRPQSLFVLGFVGHAARIEGHVLTSQNGLVEVETPLGLLKAPGNFVSGSTVTVAVRPEYIRVNDASPEPDSNMIQATLTEIVFQGSKSHLHFIGNGDTPILVEASQLPRDLRPGATATLTWRFGDGLSFPPERSA